jgi:hypothetical protein
MTYSSSPRHTSAPRPSLSLHHLPNPTPALPAPTTPASSPPRSLPFLHPTRSPSMIRQQVAGAASQDGFPPSSVGEARLRRRRRWKRGSILGLLSMCTSTRSGGMRLLEMIGVRKGQGGRWQLERRGRMRRLNGVGRVTSGGRTTVAGTLRLMGRGWRRAGRAGEVSRAHFPFAARSRLTFSLRPLLCYLRTAPENNDHFGLTLILPRLVRVITLIGSADLGNVVASEHSQLAGEERWQLYTVREDGSGGWVSFSDLPSPFSLCPLADLSPPPHLRRNLGASSPPLPTSLPPDRVSSPLPFNSSPCSDDKSTRRRASRRRAWRCRFARSSSSARGGRGQRCGFVDGIWTGGRYRRTIKDPRTLDSLLCYNLSESLSARRSEPAAQLSDIVYTSVLYCGSALFYKCIVTPPPLLAFPARFSSPPPP